MKRPTTFGKYLLLERINVGGMAEVFIAKAFGVEGFERFLAIKKILPTMAEDQEFITMFIDEARISVQLNHANIVHITELGKYEETYFIAMEYVAGRDLRTILERYRRRKEIMPTAQAVFITSKICEGLDYAHRKKDARGQDLGIIHRDVSPQNILVSYEGEVKLIDFGIAKAANRSQKTQAGILKGKFGYMSPEQVRGMPTDRRSDIFAVGVILYELVTGEKLFVGESDFSTLEKVRNADVPSPREFNPNIPSGLEKVILKALAREPEERYQWASDLQEDLMRFLLAGDAIYSSKHMSSFMKEAFAEDMLREAEKMERFASIERPEQIETSGVTALPPPPRTSRKSSAVTPVAPTPPAPAARTASASHHASAAPPLVPPPSEEELAEMDGAGDKTQIVDSAMAMGEAEGVLYDDSQTGKNANPLDDSQTGRTENPLDDSHDNLTIDDSRTTAGLPNPFASEETMAAPMPTSALPAVRKGKSGPKSQVVIGEGEPENYAGATMIGPAPTSRGRADEFEDEAFEEEADEEMEVGNGVPDPARTLPPRSAKARAQKLEEEEEPEGYDEGEEPEEEPRKPVPAVKPGKAAKAGPSAPRKPINPKPFIIGGAVVVVLGLIGTVVALVGSPSTGSVMFTVEPASNAKIQVDGQGVEPNTVIELSAGAHRVLAAAPGFKVLEQTVNVTEGQAPQAVTLTLQPEAPPAEPAPAKPPTEPGEVAAAPGNTEPPKDPQATEAVAKAPETTPEPPKPTEPEPPKTFVAVFAGESGAEIQVDGKTVGQTPNAKLADLSIDKTYKFVARRAGYKPYSGEFKYGGAPELTVEFELEKEPPPKPAEPSKPPPERPKPVVQKDPPRPVVQKDPPKPVSRATGKLAASTRPAGAQIWVDGKNTGRETPVAIGNPLVLPVGARKVVFKLNGKQTKPQTVKIVEGEVAKLIGVPIE